MNNCLNTDRTALQTTNLKGEVQLFKGNKLSLFNNFAKKERNARGADDLHPIETTTPQGAVDASFGKHWWNTGPNPTYKFGDQWVVTDRLLLDVQYAHVGNNFTLGFHEPALRDVQPTLIVSSGLNGRSGQEQVFIRPVNSLTFNSNYFLPGFLGSDHALKFGGFWRDSNTTSLLHRGGFGTLRYATSTSQDCSLAETGCQVDLVRDGNTVFDLVNYSAYAQDSISRGRFNVQLGVRYDYIKDQALAANIAANPLAGPWLPALNFPGSDGIAFNDFSPRVGLTYDATGDGRTIARANYARYYGQVGNGGVANTINPVASTTLRYPWVDANKNGSADAGEIVLSDKPLSASTNWSAANPANTQTANTVDPNLKNDTTDEFIVGLDREIGAGFAVGVPGYNRVFNGVELSGRKRMSNHWMMNTSFSYNSTDVHFGSFPGVGVRHVEHVERRDEPHARDANRPLDVEVDILVVGQCFAPGASCRVLRAECFAPGAGHLVARGVQRMPTRVR